MDHRNPGQLKMRRMSAEAAAKILGISVPELHRALLQQGNPSSKKIHKNRGSQA